MTPRPIIAGLAVIATIAVVTIAAPAPAQTHAQTHARVA
jgi:hypothetical protein